MAVVYYQSDPFAYPGGAIASGVLVRVEFADTNALAPIYYNALGSRKPNPCRTDALGQVDFYVEEGDYELVANGVTTLITVDALGGPGDPSSIFLTFSAGAPGNPGIGKSFVYNDLGRLLEIVSVRVSASTVSTNPLLVDVNKNGASIFTNQAHRPQLPVSVSPGSIKVTTIDVPAFADGDALSIDVDQGNFSHLVAQVFVR